MLIHQVNRLCNTTKKALDYYEAKGLICPAVLANGYRDYSEQDVATIKEISVLRQCGIGVADIKTVLTSQNKAAALHRCSYLAGIQMERLQTLQGCINDLADDYNIEKAFDELGKQGETALSVKERLVLAFPGNFGLFMAVHFGRFLNEPIHTQKQQNAYAAIIAYLDAVTLHIDPELEEFMQQMSAAAAQPEEIMASQAETLAEALNDTENFLERNREQLEQYIQYKQSDEFKRSPAGRFEQAMVEFQKRSGYQEVFLENMKILSPAYARYTVQLQQANDATLAAFPQAAELY